MSMLQNSLIAITMFVATAWSHKLCTIYWVACTKQGPCVTHYQHVWTTMDI